MLAWSAKLRLSGRAKTQLFVNSRIVASKRIQNMFAELPPDPRIAESHCTEVSHEETVRLYPCQRDNGEPGQILQNDLSGEQIVLDGAGASLHYQGGLAYLAHHDGTAKWASSLFTKSVWQTQDDHRFVFHRLQDGYRCRWCHELESFKNMVCLPLQLPESKFAQLHVWCFCTLSSQRHGRLFFELSWFLESLGLEHSREWIGEKWRKSWRAMLEKRGFHVDHFLLPFKSSAAKVSNLNEDGRCVDGHALSPPALLHWLVNLSRHQSGAADLCQRFLDKFLPPGTFEVQGPSSHCQLEILPGSLVDFRLLMTQGWRGLQGWQMPAALSKDPVHLHEGLLCMEELHKASSKLYPAVLRGLGQRLAAGWYLLAPPQALAPHCRAQAAAARKATEAQRKASDGLEKKRSAEDAALPSTVDQKDKKGKISTEDARHTAEDRYRYWMASRRALAGAAQIAISDDDTTVGGKNRMQSVLQNLETGETMWGPPLEAWT